MSTAFYEFDTDRLGTNSNIVRYFPALPGGEYDTADATRAFFYFDRSAYSTDYGTFKAYKNSGGAYYSPQSFQIIQAGLDSLEILAREPRSLPRTTISAALPAVRSKICMIKTTDMRKQQAKNRGLTLIELLVTIMIMGIVIAIAVPVIRPPVDARSVKEAARMVSTALASARTKSIETGQSWGVQFIPVDAAGRVVTTLHFVRVILRTGSTGAVDASGNFTASGPM